MSEGLSLEHRLADVLASTEGIRGEMADENRRRHGQDIRRNVAITVAVLVGVFGVVVGFRASGDAHDARGQARRAAVSLSAYKADNTRRVTTARVQDCESRNTIRKGIVEFLGGLNADRANRAQATLASPTATDEEKGRAQATLDSLLAFQERSAEAFAAEPCK